MRVLGYFDADAGIRTRLEEKLDVVPEEREQATRMLRERLGAVLDAIDREQSAAPVAKVESLEGALSALLERKRVKLGGPELEVAAAGRDFEVHVGARTVRADRTRPLSLVRELWGEAAFEPGRDPCYAIREVELATFKRRVGF